MKNFYLRISVLVCVFVFLFNFSSFSEVIPELTVIEKPGDYLPGTSLTVNGTLIVHGDLVMGKNLNLTIGAGGIVIVLGTLSIIKNVDVAADGFLIVHRVYTEAKGSGSFPPADNVYVDIVDGTLDKNDQEGLKPQNIDPIDQLVNDDTDVWDVYNDAVVCGPGVQAGTLSIDNIPSLPICGGVASPQISGSDVGNVVYEWYSSSDTKPKWEPLDVKTQNYSPGKLYETTHFYRQMQKGEGCIKDTSPVTIIVTPKPNPIGIFHD